MGKSGMGVSKKKILHPMLPADQQASSNKEPVKRTKSKFSFLLVLFQFQFNNY